MTSRYSMHQEAQPPAGTPTSMLGNRYGRPARWRRILGLGIVGVVAVAALIWLAWAAWFHATPSVSSALVSWRVLDGHSAQARVEVRMGDSLDSSTVRCVLQAQAVDHTTVGELTFTPQQGDNQVTVRTERPATALSLVGCTAPGQDRPR